MNGIPGTIQGDGYEQTKNRGRLTAAPVISEGHENLIGLYSFIVDLSNSPVRFDSSDFCPAASSALMA